MRVVLLRVLLFALVSFQSMAFAGIVEFDIDSLLESTAPEASPPPRAVSMTVDTTCTISADATWLEVSPYLAYPGDDTLTLRFHTDALPPGEHTCYVAARALDLSDSDSFMVVLTVNPTQPDGLQMVRSFGTSPFGECALSHDGTQLIVATQNGIAVYDSKTGVPAFRLGGLNDRFSSVDLAPDGIHLVAGGETVQIWNLATRQLEQSIGGAGVVRFSQNGSALFTGSAEGHSLIWVVDDPIRRLAFPGNPGDITNDGSLIATLTNTDGPRIRIMDSGFGDLVRELSLPGNALFTSADFSDDGTYIVARKTDDYGVWRVATGQLITSWKRSGGCDPRFLPASTKLLATNPTTGYPTIYDAATGKRGQSVSRLDYPHKLAISADGRIAAGVRSPLTGVTVELATNKSLAMVQTEETYEPGQAISSSADGSRILVGGYLHCDVIDIGSGVFTDSAPNVADAVLSPSGNIYAYPNGTSVSGRRLNPSGTFNAALGSACRGLSFSSNSALILATLADGRLLTLNATNGLTVRTLSAAGSSIYKVAPTAWSPSTSDFVTYGRGLQIWNATSGARTDLTTTGSYLTAVWSPGGARIAAALETSINVPAVEIWDATSKTLLRTLTSDQNASFGSLAFSANGQRLLGGLRTGATYTHGELVLWNPNTGEELGALQGPSWSGGYVSRLGTDGWVTISGDRTVQVWRPDASAIARAALKIGLPDEITLTQGGTPTTLNMSVQTTSTLPISFLVGDSAEWVAFGLRSVASASAPASMRASFDTSGLPVGTYRATVGVGRFDLPGSPFTRELVLRVVAPTPTPSPSPVPSPTPTATPTPTGTPTETPTPTATPTATTTPTLTMTPTPTQTPAATETPTPTPTATPTKTPTRTATPTATSTPTLTMTPTPTATPVPSDSDRDGLNDSREATLGTNPGERDSDRDGVEDGVEVALGTDPLDPQDPAARADDDGDGIPDVLDADPTSRDSDGDGYLDSYELATGSDPADSEDSPSLGDANRDGDAGFVDAVVIFNIFLGNYNAGDYAAPQQLDVNRDSVVDSVDGVILLNWYLGNIPIIPFQ